MPSAPVSASGFPKSMVVAMGIHTQHWRETAKEFPGILNCCIDVRKAFTKEFTESTSGTGFDGRVRGRREIAHLTRINDDTSSREYECRSGIHLRELGSA